MFKAFRDGRNTQTLIRLLDAADAAIAAKRIDLAEPPLNQAYDLSLQTTTQRTILIKMIFAWGALGVIIRGMGQTELADRCKKMSALLQARFDAGDFYQD